MADKKVGLLVENLADSKVVPKVEHLVVRMAENLVASLAGLKVGPMVVH